VLVLALVVIIAVASVYAAFYVPRNAASQLTTSTAYEADASAVVADVVRQSPGGYVASSSAALKPSLQDSSSVAYVILGRTASTANVTVIVFERVVSAQGYFDRFRSSIQGLPGYTDISGTLTAYQKYGACYGYGEDVDGIGVAAAICTKGNVFLQVHLTSSNDFSSVEADLTTLMAAVYGSVG